MNVSGRFSIRVYISLGAILLTLTGILFYLNRDSETGLDVAVVASKPLSSNEIPMSESDASARITLAEYSSRSAYGPLQPYLSDVEIDGSLQMSADGHLIKSKKIRQLFDFFLMAINDEGLTVCSGRIKEMIIMSLTGEARKEAIAIWEAYNAYRLALPDASAMNEHVTVKTGLPLLENNLGDRIQLRRKYMSQEVVNLFFGEEEAYDRYILDRMRIQRNSSLTEPEKAAAIGEIADQLPAPLAEKEANIRKEKMVETEINRLKQTKDSASVFALRESYFGGESARRLSLLDQKTESLNRRIIEFQQFKQSTTEDPELTKEEKMRQIEAAQKTNFSEWERPMLRRFDNTPIKKGKQTT